MGQAETPLGGDSLEPVVRIFHLSHVELRGLIGGFAVCRMLGWIASGYSFAEMYVFAKAFANCVANNGSMESTHISTNDESLIRFASIATT